MNKFDIRNSFRKVMLSFEADRNYLNSIRFLAFGLSSFVFVLAFYIKLSNYWSMGFFVLPVGSFWMSLEYYRKSRSAEDNLRQLHSGEINSELRKFSAEEFKKTI